MALTYGNPQPSLQFSTPAGTTNSGEISITADGGALLQQPDGHRQHRREPLMGVPGPYFARPL
jgi:hypothetical protein